MNNFMEIINLNARTEKVIEVKTENILMMG